MSTHRESSQKDHRVGPRGSPRFLGAALIDRKGTVGDRITAETTGPKRTGLEEAFTLATGAMTEFHFLIPYNLMAHFDVRGWPRRQRRPVSSLSDHGTEAANSFGKKKEFLTFKMHSDCPIGEMKFSAFT